MKNTINRFLAFTALSLGAIISGCQFLTDVSSPGGTGAQSGTVYIWLAPYTDTKVTSENPDMNYRTAGDVTAGVKNIPGFVTNLQISYIKYLMPVLPPGTEIEESYFEAFHSGKQEDGTTDNVLLNLSEVGTTWDARTVTWNNGPDNKAYNVGLAPYSIKLHSQDWSGTEDITPLVKRLIDDPSSNTGFRLTLRDPQSFFKSFYSNNDFHGRGADAHRSDSTLGKAPRLLIKIVLPAGKTTKDIYYPSLPQDHDIKLGTFFKTRGLVWMAEYSSGSDWPAAWGVKRGQ